MKKSAFYFLICLCLFSTASCSKAKSPSVNYKPAGDYKFSAPSAEKWTLSPECMPENATGVKGFTITPKYAFISNEKTASIVISTVQYDESTGSTMEDSISTYTELLKSSLEKNGTCKIEKETLDNGMNYKIVANVQDMIFLKVIYYVYDFNALSVDFLLPASEYKQCQTDIVSLLDNVTLK